MTDHDPLAQRMVKCPDCKGTGRSKYKHHLWPGHYVPCRGECHGTGQVPEPPEVWAEQLAQELYATKSNLHHVTEERDILNGAKELLEDAESELTTETQRVEKLEKMCEWLATHCNHQHDMTITKEQHIATRLLAAEKAVGGK